MNEVDLNKINAIIDAIKKTAVINNANAEELHINLDGETAYVNGDGFELPPVSVEEIITILNLLVQLGGMINQYKPNSIIFKDPSKLLNPVMKEEPTKTADSPTTEVPNTDMPNNIQNTPEPNEPQSNEEPAQAPVEDQPPINYEKINAVVEEIKRVAQINDAEAPQLFVGLTENGITVNGNGIEWNGIKLSYQEILAIIELLINLGATINPHQENAVVFNDPTTFLDQGPKM